MGGSTQVQNAKSDSEKAKEKLGVPNFRGWWILSRVQILPGFVTPSLSIAVRWFQCDGWLKIAGATVLQSKRPWSRLVSSLEIPGPCLYKIILSEEFQKIICPNEYMNRDRKVCVKEKAPWEVLPFWSSPNQTLFQLPYFSPTWYKLIALSYEYWKLIQL